MRGAMLLAAVLLWAVGCNRMVSNPPAPGSFGDDVQFMKKNVEVIVLSDRLGQAQVAVVPAYQGRVMTSTATGDGGNSFGWVNRELIASVAKTGEFKPHINVFGGEDRFWIGPEGGQFSVFFAKDAEQVLANWFTPACIDTEGFDIVDQTSSSIKFRRNAELTNASDAKFNVQVDREVILLDLHKAMSYLTLVPSDKLKVVAYESINSVTNKGDKAWKKDSGLISIWMLGMFNASPASTVVIPFRPGTESALGPAVHDEYFGKVPAERLVVKDKVLFFSADATCRSKIGIPPKRALPILGSYDAQNKVLTLVQYTLPIAPGEYVNSQWCSRQENPFSGDVVNSYNDGPQAPKGPQLGKFYELESSSPALALTPGEKYIHIHRTFHIQGDESELDAIARTTLGVGLDEIKTALPKIEKK